MSGSPGLCSSIHALILGSLVRKGEGGRICIGVDRKVGTNAPFVLFPDVVAFAEVDKVSDRLCGKEHKSIYNVDLKVI